MTNSQIVEFMIWLQKVYIKFLSSRPLNIYISLRNALTVTELTVTEFLRLLGQRSTRQLPG